MEDQFSRTEILLGKDAILKLKSSRVAIFGVGGVGGYVCEALARSGVGGFDLIDKDTVSISNINRQIIATMDTVGLNKTEVMRDRILSINPKADVRIHNMFYLPENKDQFDFSQYDYVIDCVDTVTAKISIIMEAKRNNTRIISSMGAGNKLDPCGFMVADINQTSVCPLARVMRYELKKRNIKGVKVVYSKEKPIEGEKIVDSESGKVLPGSIAFVPSVCGLIIASEVVKDLIRVE